MQREPYMIYKEHRLTRILANTEFLYFLISLSSLFIIGHLMQFFTLFFDKSGLPLISVKPLSTTGKVNIFPNIAPFGDKDKGKLKTIHKHFLKIWRHYRRVAWGHDFMSTEDPFYNDTNNVSYTINEALPTLHLMGLKEEFAKAIIYLNSTELSMIGKISRSDFISRVLGPILSVTEMTHYVIGRDTMQNYLRSFILYIQRPYVSDTMYLDFQGKTIVGDGVDVNAHLFGSQQLDLLTISKYYGVKGESSVIDLALRMYAIFITVKDSDCLFPDKIDFTTGKDLTNSMTYSYLGRSYLDNFVKANILTNNSLVTLNRRIDGFEAETEKAGMRHGFYFLPKVNGEVIDEVNIDDAYIPGMLILQNSKKYQKRADEYLEAFLNLSQTNSLGLIPSKTSIKNGLKMKDRTFKPPSRLMESLFYMYRKTHDIKYRKIAWDIYLKTAKYCGIDKEFSYVEISEDGKSVTPIKGPIDSSVFSSFYTFTYMLFEDSSYYPLDYWVYSWSGHPLPIRTFRQKLNSLTLPSSLGFIM